MNQPPKPLTPLEQRKMEMYRKDYPNIYHSMDALERALITEEFAKGAISCDTEHMFNESRRFTEFAILLEKQENWIRSGYNV